MKHLKTFENTNVQSRLFDYIRIYGKRNINKIKNLLFKNKNMDLNCFDRDGMTPLMWASYGDNLEILEMLIDAGADWNVKDSEGDDFLTYTLGGTERDIIKKYPEKYKEYLFKKEVEKYNL